MIKETKMLCNKAININTRGYINRKYLIVEVRKCHVLKERLGILTSKRKERAFRQ